MKKTLLTIIISGIIFTSIGATAAYVYTASEIAYSPTDTTWDVDNVQDAIDDLKVTCSSGGGGCGFKNEPNLLSDNYSQSDFFLRTTIIASSGSSRYAKTGTNSITKTSGSLTLKSSCGTGPGGSGIDYYSNYLVYTPPVSNDYTSIRYKVDSANAPGKSGYNDNNIYLENLITGERVTIGSLNSTGENVVTIPQSFKDNLTNNMMRIVLSWGAYDGDNKTVVLSKLQYE